MGKETGTEEGFQITRKVRAMRYTLKIVNDKCDRQYIRL